MATYSNPIIPGFYPDPSIIRVGSDYYCVASTFEYFPGVPVLHSRDLVNWRTIGHCLTRPNQLDLSGCPSSRGIWAATIRHNNGRFFMITTVMNHGTLRKFLVHTTDPAGEWSDPVWIDQPGIDPSLLFDDDGSVYLTSNGVAEGKKGFNQALLDPMTGRLLTPDRHIWAGTGGAFPEGPRLFKRDRWYYLSVAEGGCQYGHFQSIARSRSPWGPFEACPRNPIATHRDRGRHAIHGVGHLDFFTDTEGNWWASMLAYRPSRQFFYHLGRETFLAPVTWTPDGWPVVGNDGVIELEMDGPLPAASPWPAEPITDKFAGASLGVQYVHLRNPQPSAFRLEHGRGLVLTPNSATLNDVASPAFVGGRQCHFDVRVSVTLSFEPAFAGHEAGLTAYYQEEYHYEVAKVWSASGPRLIVRRRVGDLQAVVADVPAPAGPVELVIEADSQQYRMGFIEAGNFRVLASGRTQHLSCESAPVGFTGVILAMYATTGGAAGAVPASSFSQFTYQSLPPNPPKP